MSRWRDISTALIRPRWAFAVVGLVALVLFTAFSRYPTFYNADEHIKSGFARGIEVNMNHPLLLMGSSWVVSRVFHTKSSGSVIKTGRIVSALFAVATVLALMGVAWKLHGPAEGWAAGLLCVQGWHAADALDRFAHDSRRQLARWASKNMPREARVLADRYARIEPKDWKSAGIKLHFSVTSLRSAADYGTLDATRRGGFTHVAVCSMDYGRFFANRLRPVEGFAEDAAGHRRFYEQLFREGEPVWQSDAGRRPIVYMFKIAPAGKPASATKMRFDAVDTVEAMP